MTGRRRREPIRVELSLGREALPRGGSLWVPALKLGALALVALLVMNRRDIRRYLRLRRM